jgi:hypothetical protein
MTTLLDIRSLWRLSVLSKRRLNSTSSSTLTRRPLGEATEPTTALRKVIGMSNPHVLDMPASYFWQLVNGTSDESSIVVPIIGDLLRDSIEDKSLPWYPSSSSSRSSADSRSSYFLTLISSFADWKKYRNVTLVLRNELGTSVPLRLRKSNCDSLFESLHTAEARAAWLGYIPSRRLLLMTRMFTRNKFSAHMTLSDGQRSKSITFVICKHDFGALEMDSAHYTAIQPFLTNDCTSPARIPLPAVTHRRSPPNRALHSDRYLRPQRRVHRVPHQTSLPTTYSSSSSLGRRRDFFWIRLHGIDAQETCYGLDGKGT